MAIAEHASTPAIRTGTGTAAITTASFSPPAGSLLLVMAGGGWSTSAASGAINDSTGATYTRVLTTAGATGTANGGIGVIWFRYLSSAPGAMTVTFTPTIAGGGGTYLAVRVLTGAASNQSSVGQIVGLANGTATTNGTVSVASRYPGSVVYGLTLDTASNHTLTAAANTTFLNGFYNDATDQVSMAAWRSTATTTGATLSYGATLSTAGTNLVLAWEVAPTPTFITTGLTGGGVTTNYNFSYDSNIPSSIEPARTNGLIAQAQADHNEIAPLFGMSGSSITNITVRVGFAATGAEWSAASLAAISNAALVGLNPGITTTANSSLLLRYLLTLEVSELFMAVDNTGWFYFSSENAAYSNSEGGSGEGLSHVMGMELLRRESNQCAPFMWNPEFFFGISNEWLNTVRTDYVNNTPDDLRFGPIAGAATLFINYLLDHKSFSLTNVVNTPGGSATTRLTGIHQALTGDATNPFPAFKSLIDTAFPSQTASRIGGINPESPWPLPRTTATPTILEHASAPAIVSGTGTGAITTAAFSPPAGSLLVVMAVGGWSTSAGSIAVSDSTGGAWTTAASSVGSATTSNGGAAGIYTRALTSAPGSMTVTLTPTLPGGGGTYLVVKVLTGVNASQVGRATATYTWTRGKNSSLTQSMMAITPTTSGSMIYGVTGNPTNSVTWTPAHTITTLGSASNATDVVAYAAWKTTTPTGSTVVNRGHMVGGAWSGGAQPNIAAIEILPASTGATVTAAASFAGAGSLTAAASISAVTTVGFAGAGAFSTTLTQSRATAGSFAGAGALTAAATRVQPATVTLGGTGSLTAAAVPVQAATTALSGAGALTATGTTAGSTAVAFSGAGALSLTAPNRTTFTASGFAGAGAFTASALAVRAAAAALSGSGALTAAVTRTQPATMALSGSGALGGAAFSIQPAAVVLGGTGSFGVGTLFGGADSTTWPAPWTTVSGTNATLGNRGRQVTASGAPGQKAVVRANTALATGRVTATFRFPVTGNVSMFVGVRYGPDTDSGYRLELLTDSPGMRLVRVDVGAVVPLAVDPVMTWAADTDYRVAVSFSGGLIRAKRWAASSAEPTTWQLTALDTTYTTGDVVLGTVSGATPAAVAGLWDDLSFDTAARGLDPTRVGYYTDSFLASGDTTFSTFSPVDATATRTYLSGDSTPVGGRTGGVNAPTSQWPNAATELAALRFSYLDGTNDAAVLTSWGANRDIAARSLGYRLRLSSAIFPDIMTTAVPYQVTLTMVNDGYAAPYRGRPVHLLFVSGDTVHTQVLDVDVRTLGPGTTTLTRTVTAPPTTGTWNLFLALPDPNPGLATDPAYAIQLANTGTWDPDTGRNDLGHSVTVTSTPTGLATQITVPSTVSLAGQAALSATPLVQAPAAITWGAVASLTSTAQQTASGQTALSGTGTLGASVAVTAFAPTAFTAAGALTSTPLVTAPASVAMSGVGQFLALLAPTEFADVSLAGQAALTFWVDDYPTDDYPSDTDYPGAYGISVTASASAALSGSGSLAVASTVTQSGGVAFAGAGQLTTATVLSQPATASLAGSGSLSAAGTVITVTAASAAFAGQGALGATGMLGHAVSTTLAGAGALSAAPFGIRRVTLAFFAGQGSMVAAPVVSGLVGLAGSGSLTVEATPGRSASVTLGGTGSLAAGRVTYAVERIALTAAGSLGAGGTHAIRSTLTLAGRAEIDVRATRVRVTSISLAGSGAVTATGRRTPLGSAALAGSGQLSVVAQEAVLFATGSLSTTTLRTRLAAASLVGRGELVSGGSLRRSAALAFTGSSTFDAAPLALVRLAAIALGGSGSLAAAAGRWVQASAVLLGSGALGATPEVSRLVPARVWMGALATLTVSPFGEGRSGYGYEVIKLVSAALGGSGSLSARVQETHLATAELAAAGSLHAMAFARSGQPPTANRGPQFRVIPDPTSHGLFEVTHEL